VKAKVHTINQVRQIIHEIFVDGRVGGIHAQQVLVSGLGGLEARLGVLGGALGHLLLDEPELAALLQLLLGDGVPDLGPLLLHHLELGLGLAELGLVGVVGLHGGVELVEHFEHLLVDLEADLATLQYKKKTELYKRKSRFNHSAKQAEAC
jgi:hypothetical protein